MTFNWIVCSLSFYIVGFYLSDFPGSLYVNAGVMILADLLTWILSIPFISYLEIRNGFTAWYCSLIWITILYTFFGKIEILAYVFVFLMRFLLAMAFSLSYFGTSELFDVKVKSRSFATCNFFARTFTIASPILVEVIPRPILVITCLSVFSGVLSQFLQKGNNFKDPEGLVDYKRD